MYKILFFVLIALLSGCVTTGEKFSTVTKPDSNKALVYVYRPSTPPYLLTPTIKINDIELVELANKGFFEIPLSPGKYTIHSDWSPLSGVPDGKLTFDTTEGKTYFVLVSTKTSLDNIISVGNIITPVFTSEGNIGLVDERVALSQVTECSKIEVLNSKSILIRPYE